ncbi:MAG: CHAP domain-containing protein [Microcoleus sp. PH2017_10_PVI_O_A]|uniref:CHAP domain-containing protein n=1 Tax=unclassified Microcoleus TaxID=2642155 RepID=UPI001D7A91AD|nr:MULTISPECIES: CHAP domain-containing protein [unclassified Microcoleus]TAF19802.1 MAG: CHAP domain-containing protein [Oscillatoriales cyanobacterium]MCC3406757.1 CHAP domain-containing protein [Microcoleus sp. PH2017_10_PVI_O_A]MCC3460893.1 CHAP domain-containing protein [Microcoleus sp. PH2017_11_PCY_U_A]MCC3479414.1 CHAP domain-containing protein [Microcoleus sp. PH2017_12_PCY_D_A]MCC3529343.1 CHAP domain-containing protein [Microcoleus sp. PH2017_21_RUC_O_A]
MLNSHISTNSTPWQTSANLDPTALETILDPFAKTNPSQATKKLPNVGTFVPELNLNYQTPDISNFILGEQSPASSADPLTSSIANLPQSNAPVDMLTGSVLGQAQQIASSYLNSFANSADFNQEMKLAFGEKIDLAASQTLVQTLASGNTKNLPPVIVISGSQINNANGAFDSLSGQIYLSKEYIEQNANNPESVATVLLEEIGHFIDSQINITDAAGDEGEIFAAVVRGKELSQPEIIALKSEDDTATVTIGGKTVFIEQASPSEFQINLGSVNYSRAGNKFVASNGTGGTYLWCTDFAFGRALEKGLLQNHSGLGGKISGHAGVWDDQAGSWGRQARANSLVVWDPNQGGAGSVGHVGFVERVNSNGSFVISEANFGTAKMSFTSRTINPGSNAFNSAKFVYLSGNPTQQDPVRPGTLFRGTVDGQLNVRSGPGTNNSIVSSLSPNSSRNFDAVSRATTVWDAREQRNDDRWFRLQNTNQWVSAAFITGNPLFNGTADTTVNVRSGPGTNFPVVGSLGTNNSRTFDATTVGTTHWDPREGKNENRWFRLQNTDQWVSGAFITGNPSY